MFLVEELKKAEKPSLFKEAEPLCKCNGSYAIFWGEDS